MSKTFLRSMLFVVFLVAVTSVVTGQESILAITHVNVIDGTGTPALADMTVIVQANQISQIGKSGTTSVPKAARIVDGRGKYLIPGLWDMHVHEIFGEWLPEDEKVIPLLFVANGVTGVRDMGGDLEPLKKWRARIAAGQLIGPRMIIAGPMLDGPVPQFPSSAPVKDAAAGRKIVDDLQKNGADFIKIQSLIPRDGYFAAADEAKKVGIVFAGHVPDKVRATEASNAGQKSVEHLTGVFEGCSTVEDELMAAPRGPGRGRFLSTYDPERAKALIALFAKNQTWQVPTLYWERGEWLIEQTNTGPDPLAKYAPAAWRDRIWPMFTRDIMKGWSTDPVADREKFFQAELKMVGEMNKAGVPILVGTDTAAGVRVYPGFSLHEELELLVQAGLTPMQALQASTANAAKYLGLADTGTIEKGKRADLVLLDSNPLQDIKNTRKIQSVVLAGRYFSRADLDHLLHEVEAAVAKSK
ncbi:MAG TPA: amidohydrolase family protein [Candidatus Sulfotelmatobacter sp.]|jgi:imidazolonepropionase-like amidohydrolase|nr:amidohydrolase family protein [Candidatus Sulfotelmatobacter sp.]